MSPATEGGRGRLQFSHTQSSPQASAFVLTQRPTSTQPNKLQAHIALISTQEQNLKLVS